MKERKKNRIKIIILGLFIFLVLFVLLIFPKGKTCNYFDKKQYIFENADLEIFKEKCIKKEDQIYLHFNLKINNKINNPLMWKLSDFKLNKVVQIYYDYGPITILGNTENEINQTETFKLYLILNVNETNDELSIIKSGIKEK